MMMMFLQPAQKMPCAVTQKSDNVRHVNMFAEPHLEVVSNRHVITDNGTGILEVWPCK